MQKVDRGNSGDVLARGLSRRHGALRSVSVKQGWDLKWKVQSTDPFAQRREI